MMTRQRLVQKQRLGSASRAGFDRRCVDIKNSGARAVGRGRPVLGGRRSFAEFFDRADFKRRFRYTAKKFRQLGRHRLTNGLVAVDEIAAAVVSARRGCPEM